MTVYDVKDGTLSPFLCFPGGAAPDIFLDDGEYKLGLGFVDNGRDYCSEVYVEDTNSAGPWEFTFKIGCPGLEVQLYFLSDFDWTTYMSVFFRVRDEKRSYGISLEDSDYNSIITRNMTLEPDTEYNVKITKSGDDYEVFLDGNSIGSGISPITSFTPEIVGLSISYISGFNPNGYDVTLKEIRVGEASAWNQIIRPSTASINFSCPSATVVGNATVINLNEANSIEVWDFDTDLCGWSKVRGGDYISVENGKVKFCAIRYDWMEIALPFDKNTGIWEYDVEISSDWVARFLLSPVNSYEAWIPGDPEYDFILFEYLSDYESINLLSDDFVGRSGAMTVRLEIDESAASMFINGDQLGTSYFNPPVTTSTSMSIAAQAREGYPVYLSEVRYISPFIVPYVDVSMDVPEIITEDNPAPEMGICEATFSGESPSIGTTSHLPFNSTHTLNAPSILVQRSISIDALTPTSTYTNMNPIIREGVGISATPTESTYQNPTPNIHYGYTITSTPAYSRYSMRIWEEEEPDMVTIFPRIILKQIKEAIISPIRK